MVGRSKTKPWNSPWNIILILLCRSGQKIYSSSVIAADFRFHPRRVHVSIIIIIIIIIWQLYVRWRRETRMLSRPRFVLYLYNIVIRYVIMLYIYILLWRDYGCRVKWKKNRYRLHGGNRRGSVSVRFLPCGNHFTNYFFVICFRKVSRTHTKHTSIGRSLWKHAAIVYNGRFQLWPQIQFL